MTQTQMLGLALIVAGLCAAAGATGMFTLAGFLVYGLWFAPRAKATTVMVEFDDDDETEEVALGPRLANWDEDVHPEFEDHSDVGRPEPGLHKVQGDRVVIAADIRESSPVLPGIEPQDPVTLFDGRTVSLDEIRSWIEPIPALDDTGS